MKLRYNWEEIRRPDERFRLLKQYFHSAPALPNRAVLNLLMGSVEVSLFVDHQKRFVGYEVGRFGVVWICATCKATKTFRSQKEYNASAESYYESHEHLSE
jgi:hypothetical protein